MIKAFVVDNDRLRQVDDSWRTATGSSGPISQSDAEEERTVEIWLGVAIPTREEMEEIEISSRLYIEDGAYFMTATLPAQTETDKPLMSPVTFVLAGTRLVTVRYHEPKAFKTFPQRAEKVATGCTSGDTILIGAARGDRRPSGRHSGAHRPRHRGDLARDLRAARPRCRKRNRDFQDPAKAIGRKEDLASSIRDSLITLQRLAGFFARSRSTGRQDEQGRAQGARQDRVARRRVARRPCHLPVAEDHLPARRHARHDQHRAERTSSRSSRSPRWSSCRRRWSPRSTA